MERIIDLTNSKLTQQPVSEEVLSLRQKVEKLNQAYSLLQAQYNLLSIVFDMTEALAVIIDRKGSILRSNGSFNNHFVGPDKSMLGKNIGALTSNDPNYAPNSEVFIDWLLAKPNREAIMFGQNGKPHIISWSHKVYSDDNVSEHVILLTGIDITERKQIEGLLEQEKDLHQNLIDSVDDLIFFKDLNGKYLGCNEAFAAMIGKSRDSIIGNTDFDFYSTDKAKVYSDYDKMVIASKHIVGYESITRKSEGQEVVMETRKSPFNNLSGELLGVIGVVRDITNQKKNEEALRKAHTEIAQLIASLTSILIVLSPNLEIGHWNKTAEKVFGISAKDAIGQKLTELDIQLDWTILEENIEKCRIDKCAKYMDPIRFIRLIGTEGYLGFNISPIFDQYNDLSGFILLGADITERKTLEAQLTQAQKLESIGQLAAGIAHEINTPIQYIGDNTRFIKDGIDGLLQIFEWYDRLLEGARNYPELVELISMIKAETPQIDMEFLKNEIPLAIDQTLEGIDKVSEIVRAMKDFSHPGLITKTPIDINKAIENVVTVARNEWKLVADVAMDFDADLPTVIGNPGEISQVILNITINAAHAIQEAVKANKFEKGEIKFKTLLNGNWLEIQISDNGNGIAPHIQTRVFEPFFTTKEVGKGTGQGLAIAYNAVVKKHGGEITFDTKVGIGTTFVIRLPIQPADRIFEEVSNYD